MATSMKMSGCMKLIAKMSEADQDALLQRLDQYEADGVPADRAQFMAAQDMLAEIQGERDSLFSLLQEQHPDLFTVSEEPAAAAQMSRARAQTDTPEFKRWFGKSVVADSKGNPIVVYHGTDALDPYADDEAFVQFRDYEPIWAARNPTIASGYATSKLGQANIEGRQYDGSPTMYPVYMSIQKPLVLVFDMNAGPKAALALAKRLGADTSGVADAEYAYQVVNTAEFANAALDKGYDGIVATENGEQTYAVLTPTQIKSATGNSGAFDPANPDVRFSRARPSLGVGRDELGYTNFGLGATAYAKVAAVTNNVLDALSNKTGGKVAFKPIDPKLNRAIRQMKVELEKTQNLTANVAQQLKEIPEDERQMISDVIEGELKVGVVPPQRVLQLAASMSQIMSQQSAELVRLGMLTPEAAQRWENKYLPRFYEQTLGDEVKAWAKAAKSLFGKTRAMTGIRGNSLKARGMFETVDVADLPAWQAQGWEIRDADYDPATSTDVRIWRDYTRDERDNMGEIRDAMFRFVMGYMGSQRDVALGRLYERLNADVASRTEKPGYVLVPKTLVEDTVARRYGKLAGKWVPREVMDHLSALDSSTDNEVLQLYKKGLTKWKEGKTVLNPVAHANNIISNLTMAHFAGVSYWDVGKYAGTVRDLMRNSVLVTEAKDAGLFGGTFNRAELMDELPPQLRMLAGMTESKLAKGGDMVWKAMSFFLNKPLGKAYDAEDKFFRFLIYREARNRGLDIDDAVDYAQRFIFSYDNLPKGARAVRDFGLPFFGYTFGVIPVVARTALEHPLRMAAPMALVSAASTAMYAMAAGLGDDDDWYELLKRYLTDPEFRKRAQEMEADERQNLPEWMKGRTALGTQKTIRLGEDAVTGLPMFLDISRMVPAGDIFDVNNQAGGIPIPAPFTPNNPVLTTLYAMQANKDTFKGKDLVNQKLDTNAEAAEKRGEWLWRQFTPALAVGNYHFDRAMDAIANATGKPIDLGLGEYTGVGRDGLPVQPGLAALQTFGIKARPIDLEMSERFARADRERIIKDLQSQISQINRLEGRGAITPETAEKQRELQREKIQRVRDRLTVDGSVAP